MDPGYLNPIVPVLPDMGPVLAGPLLLAGVAALAGLVAVVALVLRSVGAARPARERPAPIVPFTETKDVVGGFTLIECASKADALEIAKACPAIEWGSVEVREIRVGPALRRR
jgi:hypothetical protein